MLCQQCKYSELLALHLHTPEHRGHLLFSGYSLRPVFSELKFSELKSVLKTAQSEGSAA